MKAAPDKSAKSSGPGAKSQQETGRSATVQQTAEAAPAAPTTSGRGLDRRSLQRLQGVAGNAAVSRLVAQRYTAPVKPPPSQAPGFRKVTSDVAAKKQKVGQHPPAAGESKSAQDAAKAPDDDKEAQGKVANSEKMDKAKPGEFDKQAFIEAVNKAIADQAPKNLDDAEKFSESGKAENVKEQVDGKVSDGKKTSAKDIESETKAEPDTSAAKEKEVTPMSPDKAPANPGAPDAEGAVPEKQPPEVTDFSEGPKANDKAMADAEVTEEQLKKGNEPDFDAALNEKKKAEADSAKAPGKARGAEKEQLAEAKENAAAEGTKAMAAMTAKRGEAGKQVDGGKSETKSKDEQKREQATAKLQKVFNATKKDVEGILEGLDKKVDDQFTKGEKAARAAFEADQSRRMKEYKDKRYSGWRGKLRWTKDLFKGLPDEVNKLYQHSRKLYVSKMQGVISSIADTIGAELGKAKARIKKGRSELKAEVDKLPEDLKKYGQDAAKDFAGKFDDLESTVNDKSKQLVTDLATKYTAALKKVDERIKELQEANKGLIDKAKDAVVGVIKTINELKDLLLGILAKAASAIMKIIKDPIGFLNNLVKAVGAGLQLFISNIADHLKKGLVSWLLGTAVKAGIELPAKFDLKGIIQLIASMLGLTWDNIRARVTRKGVPDQAMDAVESQVPVAKALAKEGPSGAADEISAQVGDVKSTILEELKSYLIPTVIVAGITWIVSLLNPASAFVRAVKAIIDIVMFVVNQGAQIVEFVNAVLDAVIEIANGGAAGVPKMVEAALAASIPLLIGLLASLLGIGGLANKVKQVIQKASRPVNRAIDKIVDKIAKAGKKLWRKLKGRYSKKANEDPSRESQLKAPRKNFEDGSNEKHELFFQSEDVSEPLMIHSVTQSIDVYLKDWESENERIADSKARSEQEVACDRAATLVSQINAKKGSLRSGSASQQVTHKLVVRKVNELAATLAVRKSRSNPPPPQLPPFTQDVLATPFKASYINKDIKKGTPSGSNDGATLRGWRQADAYNTRKDNNAWVKMHLLPAFLGGDAADSNLVPARGFVNNPMFLWATENPARAALDKKPSDPKFEHVVWYQVNINYFAAHEGFPEKIEVEWGGYDDTGEEWAENPATDKFSDRQDPPASLGVDVLRINKAGAKITTYKSLGIGEADAKKIKAFVKKTQLADIGHAIVEFPHLQEQLQNGYQDGRIRFS